MRKLRLGFSAWMLLLAGCATLSPAPSHHQAISVLRGNLRPEPTSVFVGKVVVLDFWATWCGPCLRVMPQLEKLYARYQQHPKVVIRAVNTQESPEEVAQFLKDHPIRLPIRFDLEQMTSRHFRVVGIPTTVVLDRKGRIFTIHRGYNTTDDAEVILSQDIEAALAQ